jgi:hypothetical protein
MSANRDVSNQDASRDRRWLIGISISLFFGLFGAVMALLSYWERSRPPGPGGTTTTIVAPPQASAPTHGPGKDHGHK